MEPSGEEYGDLTFLPGPAEAAPPCPEAPALSPDTRAPEGAQPRPPMEGTPGTIYHREHSRRGDAHVGQLLLMLKTFIVGQLGGGKQQTKTLMQPSAPRAVQEEIICSLVLSKGATDALSRAQGPVRQCAPAGRVRGLEDTPLGGTGSSLPPHLSSYPRPDSGVLTNSLRNKKTKLVRNELIRTC